MADQMQTPNEETSSELQRLRNQVVTLQQKLQEQSVRYTTLLDGLQDVVYELDLQGNLVYVNAAVERMLGFKPEEILGKPDATWIEKEAWEDTLDIHLRAQKEESVTGQSTLLDKQGNPHLVEIVTSQRLEGGQLVGTRSVLRDITERHKTHQILTDKQKLRQALFDAITETVIVVDRAETIVALNQTAAKRLGTTVENLVGQAAASIMPPDIGQRHIALSHELVRNKQPIRFEDQRGPYTFD